MHKIDLSGNKFQIQRFVLLQIVLALFTILFTYKWAYQTTHIIEQNLVMNLIFVFFRNDYAAANGITVKAVYGFILSIIGINGIPEAIVAAVITLVLGKTLMKKGVQERLGV